MREVALRFNGLNADYYEMTDNNPAIYARNPSTSCDANEAPQDKLDW
jgi:hypothetical protein